MTKRLKDFLRGDKTEKSPERAEFIEAFVKNGSLNLWRCNYQFKLNLPSAESAEKLREELAKEGIAVCLKDHTTYTKSGEVICRILAFMGANEIALEIWDIITKRQIANDINRRTNCEVRNIDRTMEAAARQVQTIKSVNIEKLPSDLRELARIRLEKPSATYGELAAELGVSKSCIQRRMKKICALFRT